MTAELSSRDQDLVLALVDGSFPPYQRAAAEARVLELPGGHDLLERQRSVAAALADRPRAPDSLREAIARQRARADRPRRLRLRPWALTFAGAGCALVVALALVLSAGGAPSVAQAAALGALPATEPTPASGPENPSVLDKRFESVSYPDWGEEFGWFANGARSDTIDGRRAQTVFYVHEGHRIGYTIVSGEPLQRPEDARHLTAEGLAISVYTDSNGREVAVFERNGRTCVLSGKVLGLSTLVKLAAWKGSGSGGLSNAGAHH